MNTPFSSTYDTMNKTIKAGILSDTHLTRPTREFLHAVRRCFADCDVIIHAGDITDVSLPEIFPGKTVYAVRGNCCALIVRTPLSRQLSFQLGDFTVGLIHGDLLGRYADTIESGLRDVFPEADCVIYGHTHEPVCRRFDGQLIINPGSFQTGGRYGAPCSYAILEAEAELRGTLHEFPLR
jgi:putative phosphoesterase